MAAPAGRSQLQYTKSAPAQKSQLFSTQAFTKYIVAAPGQLVASSMVANELGIGGASVWVSVWALRIYDCAARSHAHMLEHMVTFYIHGS